MAYSPMAARMARGVLAQEEPQGVLAGIGQGGLLSGLGAGIQNLRNRQPGQRPILDMLGNNAMSLWQAGTGVLASPTRKMAAQAWQQGMSSGSQVDAYRNKQAADARAQAKREQALATVMASLQESGKLPAGMEALAALPEVAAPILVDALKPRDPVETWEPTTMNGIPGQRSTLTGKFDEFTVPATPETWRPPSPQDRAAYNIPAEDTRPWQISSNGDLRLPGQAATQITIDNGIKVPPGYMPDPSNPSAVVPIPGGPAEQISPELAARLGLAKDAIERLPDVEAAAKEGDLTGPIDWAIGQMGWGQRGELTRELRAGSEAMVRMLTGAGKTQEEARAEVAQYLPAFTDQAADLTNKVQQLRRRLIEVVNEATRGRGGYQAPADPNAAVRLSGSDAEVDAAYEALPPGAHFIGPDGVERIKPGAQ